MTEAARFSFSDVRGELVGTRVALRAYISGESGFKAIFTRFTAVCLQCGTATDFDASADPKQLHLLIVRGVVTPLDGSGSCLEGGRHRWVTYTKSSPPLIYQTVLLRESTEAGELTGPTTESSYRGYLIGKVPPCKDVELEGTLVVNPENNDIELLVDKAKPTTASVDSFELETGEAEALRSYFSGHSSVKELKTLAVKNNLRIAGREEAKLATLLAYLSPSWINVNGLLVPGTLRVLLFGDARQGKGSVEDYLRQKLQLGKHAIGETSTRSGITYSIDGERGMIVWGVMVEADRGLLVLEAIHKFPPEDLATMRETLTKLYVEVRRSFSARAWARTRVVADSNSRQEMALYPYPCMALRDLPCFKDQTDMTRWDLSIPFRAGEVDPDSISDAALHGEEDHEFLSKVKRLILWAWSRKPDDISISQGAIQGAQGAYRELLARYAAPQIPVANEDSLLSILRLSAAFAALTFSTPDGVTLKIEEEHVKLATEFIEEVLEMLEIEDYKVLHGEKAITEEERNEYAGYIKRREVATKVVDALAKGPRGSIDLSEEIGHQASWIRMVCAELKSMGVIERVSAGYRLTRKGIQLWKEFHGAKVTEVTEHTERTERTGKWTPPSPGGNRG